jgi:predicted RNA-binding protein with PIN domain
MIVFVDGHNALHVLGVDAGGHEADRGTLVRDVRERVRRMTPGATVFFDGYEPPGAFAESTDRGVRVVFSRGREADEALVDAVRDAEQAGRILVVTDDLGLARRAAQLGAKTTRVRTFFVRAAEPESAGQSDEKPTGSGGFTPADFGLPDAIDLDDPAHRKGLPKPRRRRRG